MFSWMKLKLRDQHVSHQTLNIKWNQLCGLSSKCRHLRDSIAAWEKEYVPNVKYSSDHGWIPQNVAFIYLFLVSRYVKLTKSAGRHHTRENKVRHKSAKSLRLNSHRGRALRGSEVTVMVLEDKHSAKSCSLSSFLSFSLQENKTFLWSKLFFKNRSHHFQTSSWSISQETLGWGNADLWFI